MVDLGMGAKLSVSVMNPLSEDQASERALPSRRLVGNGGCLFVIGVLEYFFEHLHDLQATQRIWYRLLAAVSSKRNVGARTLEPKE